MSVVPWRNACPPLDLLWLHQADFTALGCSGVTGAGIVALVGDLPAAVTALASAGPLLTVPVKAAVAFPLVYHYAGS